MQNISVLDLLKQGKIYRADYNKIFDKDYLRQYKFLAHQAGFEDCPIFCATEKSKSIISSSGLHKSKSNVLLTLNVPDDETYCTEYYTWTDYLYFSTEDTNHSYVKELEDELEVEYQISNYKEENKERKIVVTPSSDGITVKLIYELQEEIGKQTT